MQAQSQRTNLGWRVSIMFAFLCLLQTGNAQSNLYQHRTRVSTSAQVLSPAAISDASAVQALRRAVEASGGMGVWQQIRSAKMRMLVSFPGSTQTHEIVTLDDWSSDSAKYRRGVVGGRRTPHEHNGQSTFNASDTGNKRSVAEFDQARVLAGSLPAAAAEIILRKSSYVVKQINSSQCASEMICLAVYRQNKKYDLFIREEEWTISQSTGLPNKIDIILPNLSGTRLIFEEFQFDQILTINGILIPSKITMRYPSGSIQIRTVTSFTPNAEYNKVSFDKEVVR